MQEIRCGRPALWRWQVIRLKSVTGVVGTATALAVKWQGREPYRFKMDRRRLDEIIHRVSNCLFKQTIYRRSLGVAGVGGIDRFRHRNYCKNETPSLKKCWLVWGLQEAVHVLSSWGRTFCWSKGMAWRYQVGLWLDRWGLKKQKTGPLCFKFRLLIFSRTKAKVLVIVLAPYFIQSAFHGHGAVCLYFPETFLLPNFDSNESIAHREDRAEW